MEPDLPLGQAKTDVETEIARASAVALTGAVLVSAVTVGTKLHTTAAIPVFSEAVPSAGHHWSGKTNCRRTIKEEQIELGHIIILQAEIDAIKKKDIGSVFRSSESRTVKVTWTMK